MTKKIKQIEEERLNKIKKNFALLLTFILLFGLAGWAWGAYEHKYNQQLIKVASKEVVTALEMTAACAQAGNVTQDQIVREYMEMFIYNKTKS